MLDSTCERIQLPQKWKKLSSKFHLTNNKYSLFHAIFSASIQNVSVLLSWSTSESQAIKGTCYRFTSPRAFFFNSISSFHSLFISIIKYSIPSHSTRVFPFLLERIRLNSILFFKWNRDLAIHLVYLVQFFSNVRPTHLQFQLESTEPVIELAMICLCYDVVNWLKM